MTESCAEILMPSSALTEDLDLSYRAQLAGWQARGKDQRELMRKVEWLKRQIALIEQNTGKNDAQSIPT